MLISVMQDSGGEKREESAKGLVEKGVVMLRSGRPVRISAEERGAQRFRCRRKRRSWRGWGSGVVVIAAGWRGNIGSRKTKTGRASVARICPCAAHIRGVFGGCSVSPLVVLILHVDASHCKRRRWGKDR